VESLKGWGLQIAADSSALLASTPAFLVPPDEALECQKELFAAFREERGAVAIEIQPREKVQIPFILRPGHSMTWTFAVELLDLTVRIVQRKPAAGGSKEKTLRTMDKVYAGKLYSGGVLPSISSNPNPRHIYLIFDNSASVFRAKTVCYRVESGADIVCDVNLSDMESPFITSSVSDDEVDSDAAQPIPSTVAQQAQEAMQALASRALKTAKRFSLHDEGAGDVDEVLGDEDGDEAASNGGAMSSLFQNGLSKLGDGLSQLSSEVMLIAKNLQLHDDGQGFETVASPLTPSFHPKHAATQPQELAGDISQWVAKDRSEVKAHVQEEMERKTSPSTAGFASPLILNKGAFIIPSIFQQLFSSFPTGLSLTTAVSALPSSEGDVIGSLLSHLDEVGTSVVSQSSVPDGHLLYIFASGQRLPITAPPSRPVELFAELVVTRSDNFWRLSMQLKSASEEYLQQFLILLRLVDVFTAHDEARKTKEGRRGLRLLGLDHLVDL